ncbi:helix-turn-helix domain-containing protein [bacterium]|nr:helix-turn-helix domain-containing protein [bacterium]MBU1024626.1 helix-turn-helix domain-containing protein [bacterium]
MNNLKEIRKLYGLSKWRLARETGLNWKTVHRIERGEHLPFESSKEKIASFLGVDVETVFPSKDVAHILVTEPRPIIEKKRSRNGNVQIVGYVLDRNLRRCGGLQVRLMSGRKKIAIIKSDADGRFVFEKIAPGEYQVVSRDVELNLEV